MYLSLLPTVALLTTSLLPSTTAQSAGLNTSSNAVGASPLFGALPPILTGDTDAIAAITQALSLYGIAIDTKNFTALSGVFTSDVVALVAPTPINNLAQYESFLASDLAPFKTQHITDNVFVYDIADGAAKSISYQQAVYFGSGNFTGQIVTYYERFDDVFSKNLADGSWKSAKRSINIFVSNPCSLSIRTFARRLYTTQHCGRASICAFDFSGRRTRGS